MFKSKSVIVTRSLIPGPGHHLRESPSKTQEVRESTDCPQEDHSGLPGGHLVKAQWLTLKMNGPHTLEWEFQDRTLAI